MVAWRVAESLLVLRDQWHKSHPGAANPGFIGDEDHATRDSDHNPWVDDPSSSVNVVTAGDFYHQPHLGADAYALAEELKARKDPRVKYVISRGRIWSLARNREGWRKYNGPNPHTGHTHVSVSYVQSLYDNRRPWLLPGAATPEGDDVISKAQMAELKKAADDSARRWALWQVLFGLQAEDDLEAARIEYRQAYDAAKAAGKTEAEAEVAGSNAAARQLQPLTDAIKRDQAAG
jgi:hypothetical protein